MNHSDHFNLSFILFWFGVGMTPGKTQVLSENRVTVLYCPPQINENKPGLAQ